MLLVASSYLWLGLERLAHGTEDVDLAGGEAGGVGGFACHGVMLCGVGVWFYEESRLRLVWSREWEVIEG
jgi:hypothetical protein